MKIIITNPTLYYTQQGLSIGYPLESKASRSQIIDLVRRLLLSRGIVCDNIEINEKRIKTINEKRIKTIDDYKSAQELIDDSKRRRKC